MKIIVIDDDPTGSQTVNNCLLLLKWDRNTLIKGFKSKSNLFFILANTRSLSEKDAKLRLEDICNAIKSVICSERYKEKIIIVSRGDSTLRGHNFLEPDVINDCLGPFDATFHIPAFIEGKRFTIDGLHFVDNIPVSQTIFAKDKIFGFKTSNIKNLLFQKSKLQINLNDIQNLKSQELNILETNENNIVYKKLKNLKKNSHVIVDVENYSQLKKFSLAINKLIKEKKFLFRTAASFISSISGIKNNCQQPFFYSNLRRRNREKKFLPGMIIVGSYVELSTIQLKQFLDISDCELIELDVFEFYKIFASKQESAKLILFKNKFIDKIRCILKKGKTPVIFTSRKEVSLDDNHQQINLYNSLANFISELVADLKNEIGYLVSKGGITSNVILSNGLKANYVYLQGQIITGISLVTLKLENEENLPIVTFPGNIGSQESLVTVWKILENKKLL
ncbi:Uncharacterized protein conserved in bacteria [Prochlorococcus marinus str. MIT 9515]|uniref:Uncharacterized protein conserved in bacteria n=1 Tax=Prochlorococcus marinus (strain MIT 9515) TaxID=167542 RepID=A2BYY0_PROM5|nr:four-carbon acid sugar kinase family protein [Prochlorococcus marinus]ABM72991.1 Uncharacterized protein conserved in bacteria [Prochlorococcus marinus str. MIT 9515]